MLSVHCPRHQREVLLGHHQILGIDGHAHHLTIRWQCWCGYQGRLRPATRRRPPAAGTAAL